MAKDTSPNGVAEPDISPKPRKKKESKAGVEVAEAPPQFVIETTIEDVQALLKGKTDQLTQAETLNASLMRHMNLMIAQLREAGMEPSGLAKAKVKEAVAD